jgi:hypothetical protein
MSEMDKNSKFDDYDYKVIKEIALHEAEPSFVQKALNIIGTPMEKLMEYVEKSENKHIKKAVKAVDGTVHDALKITVKIANTLTSEENVIKEYKKHFGIELQDIESIKKLSLKQMDKVADTYDLSNALIVTTEGAVLGAASTLSEIIPFAQFAIPAIVTADVAASMTFMSRHVCQIATSYGFSSYEPINIPDILASMVPTNSAADEGFLITKAAAALEIREATKYASQHLGELLENGAAPKLIELIRIIATRLGCVITEKELALLVPFAGGLLNGGLNLAFQQMNHTNAKDYFRRLHLVNTYGEEEVFNAIEIEKQVFKNKAG